MCTSGGGNGLSNEKSKEGGIIVNFPGDKTVYQVSLPKLVVASISLEIPPWWHYILAPNPNPNLQTTAYYHVSYIVMTSC